jgi:hypothetical protein
MIAPMLVNWIARAAHGDQMAMGMTAIQCSKMEEGSEKWSRLALSIKRIIDGERDLGLLTKGLDSDQVSLIRRSLELL